MGENKDTGWVRQKTWKRRHWFRAYENVSACGNAYRFDVAAEDVDFKNPDNCKKCLRGFGL